MSAAEVAVAACLAAAAVLLWVGCRTDEYDPRMWRHDPRVAHRGGCSRRDLESQRRCVRRRRHWGRHRVEKIGPPDFVLLAALASSARRYDERGRTVRA